MALVTNEQVIKVLRQHNPWWRNPAETKEESKPLKRVVSYEAMNIMRHKTVRRLLSSICSANPRRKNRMGKYKTTGRLAECRRI